MKITEVLFTEDSRADYNALSTELKDECYQLLCKLEQVGKALGIELENKNGRDLRGYYKLYFNEAQHRIVYTVSDEKIEITAVGEVLKESLEITGIGKRDKAFIYDVIQQRIQLQKGELNDEQKDKI
jgi:Txe/YoeB family toxin of Txe-Axe toxin-antitoxin module